MSYKTMQEIKDARELISPPGDTLRETIEARAISQKELALRMSRPIKTINEIIQGRAAITPETALQLERVLQIPADFWQEREKRYRLKLAELAEAEQMLDEKEWTRKFPLSKMEKMGWLTFEANPVSKMNALLSFFEVSGKEGYYSYYHKEVYATAYRMSKSNQKNPYAIAAWLKQGERQASVLEIVPEYNAKAFKQALTEVKKLMAMQPGKFLGMLQNICAKAGVKVVHTPCLPGTKLHGSTRWIKGVPLIQLSNLYKRNDIFWFTFFHEAGHIVKHGRKQMFLEGLEDDSASHVAMENEANEFAQNHTLTVREEEEIRANPSLEKADIIRFAQKFGTHPAVIMGRLGRSNRRLYQKGWTMHFFQKIDLTDA